VGSSSPDEVEVNGAGTNTFQIYDLPSDASWQLLTTGQIAHVLDDGTSFADGTWTAVLVSPPQVPEPSSLLLVGVGLIALALWGRRKTA